MKKRISPHPGVRDRIPVPGHPPFSPAPQYVTEPSRHSTETAVEGPRSLILVADPRYTATHNPELPYGTYRKNRAEAELAGQRNATDFPEAAVDY